jgi:pyruvate/2-oxoglutarate dehydrogenase complex dihydrolipoamide dehydrogenase (E3) component
MDESLDAIVIGMGVAGEAVVGDLPDAGLSVLGIDRELVGGQVPLLGVRPLEDETRWQRAFSPPSNES